MALQSLGQIFEVIEPFGAVFTDAQQTLQGAKPPYWFAIEGEDGVGKSHLANALKYDWSKQRIRCVVEAFGKHFRLEEYAHPVDLTVPYTNEFFFRHEQLADLYDAGFSIIQDRSFLSTLVYQEDIRVLRMMDTLYGATGICPTHIFILPQEDGGYGRYDRYRDCTEILLPLSRQQICLIFVPQELTLFDRKDFVRNTLANGIILQGNLSSEETVQIEGSNDGGDNDGDAGNLSDGTG